MNEINWECPMCGNENTENVQGFDKNDSLVKYYTCKQCDEKVVCCVEYAPKITELDLM